MTLQENSAGDVVALQRENNHRDGDVPTRYFIFILIADRKTALCGPDVCATQVF